MGKALQDVFHPLEAVLQARGVHNARIQDQVQDGDAQCWQKSPRSGRPLARESLEGRVNRHVPAFSFLAWQAYTKTCAASTKKIGKDLGECFGHPGDIKAIV